MAWSRLRSAVLCNTLVVTGGTVRCCNDARARGSARALVALLRVLKSATDGRHACLCDCKPVSASRRHRCDAELSSVIFSARRLVPRL
jgi:hypothetical protein